MTELQRMSLFDISVGSRERLSEIGEVRGIPAFELDVPETIPQLGYGSHQFFRYYGKFPSVVGAEIIARFGSGRDAVLDVYAGSGTTLVEAQSAGLPSFGIDVNPLAVLASNVKTSYIEADEVRDALSRVMQAAIPTEEPRLPRTMTVEKLAKWFRPEVQAELSALRDALLCERPGAARDLLLVAFLGIIRRVSNAYDGEVRPHVNPDKRNRSPLQAFWKKGNEMILALREVDELRPRDVRSETILGDNRDPDVYDRLLGSVRPSLIVAHPPYLNSFNYLSVFSLEFAWAEDFSEIWAGRSLSELRKAEHTAWPATNESVVRDYYGDFSSAMSAACGRAAPNAIVAIVVGDATIRGTLESVHERCWDALVELGLTPHEIWYRTTHYGIGKYAYRQRADYHGDALKKDAVLFFAKN